MGRGDALASGQTSAQFTAPQVTDKEFEERVGKTPRKKKIHVEEEKPITTSVFGVGHEVDGQYVPERDLTHQEGNVFYAGETGFEAAWTQVVVLQDEYHSGMECQTCLNKYTRNFDGKDLSVIRCAECNGLGQRPKAGNDKLMVRCPECAGRGDVVCPDCKGHGATIITPEKYKTEPTCGTIVSLGPKAENYSLGERVLFMNYSGSLFNLTVRSTRTGKKAQVAIRVISDSDIRCKLHGYINAKELRSAYALYTAE